MVRVMQYMGGGIAVVGTLFLVWFLICEILASLRRLRHEKRGKGQGWFD